MNIWEPEIGELLVFTVEVTNMRNRNAVGVLKDGQLVGHAPLQQSSPKTFPILIKGYQQSLCGSSQIAS